jgi:hypothetical protein
LASRQVRSYEVLPIFRGRLDVADRPPAPLAHLGTGFLIAPQIFVTCAHSVPLDLDGNEVLFTMFENARGR